jgi:hypothetical protein
MKASAFALAALMVAGATPALAKTSIPPDGSFEDPLLHGCCTQTFKVGQTLGTWTVIGPAKSKVVLTSGTLMKGPFLFDAEDGNQWLNIAGKAGAGVQEDSQIERSVEFTLSYAVGTVYDPTGKNGSSSTVQLIINGNPQPPVTAVAVDDGKNRQQWTRFSTVFTCGCDKVTIAFVNADAKSDRDTAIDDIQLKKAQLKKKTF